MASNPGAIQIQCCLTSVIDLGLDHATCLDASLNSEWGLNSTHSCFPPSSPGFKSCHSQYFFTLQIISKNVLRLNPSSAKQWISQTQVALMSRAKCYKQSFDLAARQTWSEWVSSSSLNRSLDRLEGTGFSGWAGNQFCLKKMEVSLSNGLPVWSSSGSGFGSGSE